MKKNVMMRVASALLVAVLLSTCAISGTFAKYVTSDSAEDTARVAKWGVTIESVGTMFKANYDDTVVAANGTDKLIAPGTSGALADVVVTGQPEVDVTVTYDATLTLTGWALADSSEYCPVVFTINGKTYATDDANVAVDNLSTDLADLKADVEAAIEASTKTYDANTDLSTVVAADVNVSWAWAFETGDDTKDTYLGNQAAIGSAPSITLSVTTTITQID